MPPPQQGTGWVLAGQGLASIPPCNRAEPLCCSSESFFFLYILIPFQVTVFPVKFPQFAVYPSLNKFVSACCFIFHALHVSNQPLEVSHNVSSRLSRYLGSLSLGCESGLYQNQPSVQARPQPREEDCEQALRSDSDCGHNSASCYEMLKTEMFFSRERRCS